MRAAEGLFGESMALGSVDGFGVLSLGFEIGLPDIMAAHTASTSIVAADVSARGFFSTFLRRLNQLSIHIISRCVAHTLEPAYSLS